MEIDNEQLQRLKAAGWECSWEFYTEIRLGDGGDVRRFTVHGEKASEKIVVVSERSNHRSAWEHLYLEAKRVDPDLRGG